MPSTTITEAELDQDPARALAATADGPVLITNEHGPAFVLLSFEEYRRLGGMIPDEFATSAFP